MCCNDDAPSAFCETWRIARKAHICCECDGEIAPKERYQYASGVWDGRGMDFKTCAPCAAAKEFHIEHLSRHDCRPCFTQLYDEWPAESLPEHIQSARAVKYDGDRE